MAPKFKMHVKTFYRIELIKSTGFVISNFFIGENPTFTKKKFRRSAVCRDLMADAFKLETSPFKSLKELV
jgi:hypothetical protein